MSSKRPVRIALAVAMSAVLVAADAGVARGAPAPASSLYIVQLAAPPVATYVGGVSGIPATRPAPGKKIDLGSSAAKAYRTHLKSERQRTQRRAGISAAETLYEYDVAFSGYAARMSAAEADTLRRSPGVLAVSKNTVHKADTISTPEMLGLTGRGGVWQREFGGSAKAGLGVIVGVIDSGIWPENPAFAALPNPRPDQRVIDAKWRGVCQRGEETDPARNVTCNNKLIGARYFTEGTLDETNPGEFRSPRDFNGHGSHTAGTAVGGHNVDATIDSRVVGKASGMAPAARLAVYKALWDQGGGSSGSTVDLVAAINAAVADGVDVINYSISGSTSSFVDPVELAFLNAANAGVFVAASAGNSGPGASTVAHNSPWITTVAASTHDRGYEKSVTLGNGTTYQGVGQGTAVPSAPLIDSVQAGLSDAPASEVQLCYSGRLDPAKVTGKVVLCLRGGNARTDKSLAVKQAGGVGMILYNNPDNSLNADYHFVPSIHVNSAAGLAVKAYAATAGATATLSAGTQVKVRAPEMAAFSSRGPALAGNGDLLKPDITAPGVDVVAPVAPPGNLGRTWDAYSGTSMSSPHIAGLAALMISENPGWSPMWVKSAMMTTAGQTDNSGQPIQRAGAAATPLDFGAGHVRPGPAYRPGLVYDSTYPEWIRFACGSGATGAACDEYGSADPSNLNYPSIAVGDLAGQQTVTRTVKNVSKLPGVYEAKIQAPAGTTVTVTPKRFVILPGKSTSFKVTVTRTDAAIGQWTFGALTWVNKAGANGLISSDVRSPIAIRPVALAAPREVAGSGVSGSAALRVTPGFSGTLTATPAGLVPSTVNSLHLVGTEPDFDTGAPAAGPAVAKVTLTVPAGTRLARSATFDADHPDGTDLDLFAYRAGTTTLVGSSAGATAEERLTLAPGTYDIYVVLFAAAPGTSELDVKHHSWIVGDTPAGNLTATPPVQTVTRGQPVTVTAAWTGLTAGARYLGLVAYGDGTTGIGQTVMAVTA
ncbi:peptidase inhibitor I9 [Paractinoplanes brasiliensis]|uniref:Peptidase inhibitor I9 n=1 Tax=Paractinoplanes brasiliensis TaxID=52695 RepID=A0A4R6JYT8_9ACTN|nr:peptidase inhibitor I9 [Actinoplanes brasiliensis]